MLPISKNTPNYQFVILVKKPFWAVLKQNPYLIKTGDLTAIEKLKVMGIFRNFIYLSFLNQRLQTGGLTGYDLEAWHKNLDFFKKKGAFTNQDIRNFITNLNNKSPEMGDLSDDDLSFIYHHNDRNYIKVLADSLDNNGYVFDIQLSGEMLKDYEFINGFKTLLMQKGFASIANPQFNAMPCNAWKILNKNYNKMDIPKNNVRFCVTHRSRQQSNFPLYKMLVMLEKWMEQKLPKEIIEEKLGRDKPSPTDEDKLINPFDFVTLDDTILNPNAQFSNQNQIESGEYSESFVFVANKKEGKLKGSNNDTDENISDEDIEDEDESAIEYAEDGFDDERYTDDEQSIEKLNEQSKLAKMMGSLLSRFKDKKKEVLTPVRPAPNKIPVPPPKKEKAATVQKVEEVSTQKIDKNTVDSMLSTMFLQNVWVDSTMGCLFKVNLDYRHQSIESRGDNGDDVHRIMTV